jgi:hypothetical protein
MRRRALLKSVILHVSLSINKMALVTVKFSIGGNQCPVLLKRKLTAGRCVVCAFKFKYNSYEQLFLK